MSSREDLSIYIEKTGNTHNLIREWIKDFTILIEKNNLTEGMKRSIFNDLVNRKERLFEDINTIEGNDEIINIMKQDIIEEVNRVHKYGELFIMQMNLPNCVNQPPHKRDYLYVLVGLVSMMNENLYVYRVENFKHGQI